MMLRSPCRRDAAGENGLDDLLNVQGFSQRGEMMRFAMRESHHALDLAPDTKGR